MPSQWITLCTVSRSKGRSPCIRGEAWSVRYHTMYTGSHLLEYAMRASVTLAVSIEMT